MPNKSDVIQSYFLKEWSDVIFTCYVIHCCHLLPKLVFHGGMIPITCNIFHFKKTVFYVARANEWPIIFKYVSYYSKELYNDNISNKKQSDGNMKSPLI